MVYKKSLFAAATIQNRETVRKIVFSLHAGKRSAYSYSRLQLCHTVATYLCIYSTETALSLAALCLRVIEQCSLHFCTLFGANALELLYVARTQPVANDKESVAQALLKANSCRLFEAL